VRRSVWTPGEERPHREAVFEVQAHAAAFYVSLLKAQLLEEASEFAEWYLDTFDHDLET
jgi:hypothetical protein